VGIVRSDKSATARIRNDLMNEDNEDARKDQVHQQLREPKLDADPEPWFAELYKGATAERARLEVLIRKLRGWLRGLEFLALLLSVASATTLFAA
jgi:hypothetical protein